MYLVLFSIAASMLAWYGVIAVLLVGNAVTYSTIKPDKQPSFSQFTVNDKLWRNRILPSTLSLIAGAVLSASFPYLFDGSSEGNSWKNLLGAGLVYGTLGGFVVMLSRMGGHGPGLSGFANTPQRIMASAQEISGGSPGAEDGVAQLRGNLDRWKKNSGASSMGWEKKQSSVSLNKALQPIPASRKLKSAAVWRPLRRTGVYAAAWKTAPWLFGWPAYVAGALNIAFTCAGLVAATSWLPVARWLLISVSFSVLFVVAYQVSILLVGIRRLSLSRFYEQYCESELDDAQQRVDEHKAQVLRESLIPQKIDEIQANLRYTRAALVGGQVAVLSVVMAAPIARGVLRMGRLRR